MDEKLFVGKWFKLPPKEESQKLYIINIVPAGTGKKRSKHAKSCKKIKK